MGVRRLQRMGEARAAESRLMRLLDSAILVRLNHGSALQTPVCAPDSGVDRRQRDLGVEALQLLTSGEFGEEAVTA